MPKCSRTWYRSYNIELGGPYKVRCETCGLRITNARFVKIKTLWDKRYNKQN